MAVLYRTYRPQRFSEVVGQSHIVRTLQNATRLGQLAHAYLLTGSRGVGKTTIARIIAKAANCTELKDGDPCGKCDACAGIETGTFLDLVEIDAASHTGVDNVRELIEHVKFKPSRGRTKVFIIDEVHMLSKAAFNALLKTLEEPPEHAMFILATTDIEKVPETIISRTQRFDFRKITGSDMLAHLQSIVKKETLSLPDSALELVVQNSEGGLRDALSLLDKIAALGEGITLEEVRLLLGMTDRSSIEQLLQYITTGAVADIPGFMSELAERGVDMTVYNRGILEYLRQVLVYKLAGAGSKETLTAEETGALQTISNQISNQHLLFTIRLFLRSYKEIAGSPTAELPVLLAAIEAGMKTVTSVPTAAQPVAPVAQPRPEQPVVETRRTTISAPTTESFDTTVSLQDVTGQWQEVITRIKTINSPLATLLKNSPLQDVVDGRLIVSVKYLFHKEHLENKKHYTLITQTLSEVSGKQLGLKVVIAKESKPATVAEGVDALTDALKLFGGELVE